MDAVGHSSFSSLRQSLLQHEGRMQDAMTSLSHRQDASPIRRPLTDRLHVDAQSLARGAHRSNQTHARLTVESQMLSTVSTQVAALRDLANAAVQTDLPGAERADLQQQFSTTTTELTRTLTQQASQADLFKGETIQLSEDPPLSYTEVDSSDIIHSISGLDLSSASTASSALNKLNELSETLEKEQGRLNSARQTIQHASERAMGHAAVLEEVAWSTGQFELAHTLSEFVAASTAHTATLAAVDIHKTHQMNAIQLLT